MTTPEQGRTSDDKTFLQKHGSKLIGLGFWVLMLACYAFYVQRNNLTVADAAEQVTALITGTVWGPIIYVVIYWMRPLLFFPSIIGTMLGGFFFGPIGILYAVIGGNGSAMVAYLIGRFFGQGILDSNDSNGLLQTYSNRLRDNSFETILIMRLILLPYDWVSFFCGFLKIAWLPFLLGTAIGSVVGTASFALLGTSYGTLDELLSGEISADPRAITLSIVLILLSILISRLLKRRENPPPNRP